MVGHISIRIIDSSLYLKYIEILDSVTINIFCDIILLIKHNGYW